MRNTSSNVDETEYSEYTDTINERVGADAQLFQMTTNIFIAATSAQLYSDSSLGYYMLVFQSVLTLATISVVFFVGILVVILFAIVVRRQSRSIKVSNYCLIASSF